MPSREEIDIYLRGVRRWNLGRGLLSLFLFAALFVLFRRAFGLGPFPSAALSLAPAGILWMFGPRMTPWRFRKRFPRSS